MVSGLTSRFLLLVFASTLPLVLYILLSANPGREFLGVVTVSLLVCVAGSVLVTSRIARSLNRFGRAAARFAQGDFSSRMYPPRIPELVELSQAFNTMASQVQKRLDAISRLSAEQDAILRSMVEGVVTVDGEGRIRRVNGAARELLGISIEDCEGRQVKDVVHHPELEKFLSQSRRAPGALSKVMKFSADEERILEVYISPLREREGSDAGTLLVFHDTTRLHKLENVRRDFVANVSHELRTPITSIKGFVETLMDGAMDEPESLRKFLGIIAKHSDRLNAIFSDLLTLAQLEARDEDEELGLDECTVAAIVQSAVEACSLRASERQAHISVEVVSDLKVLGKENLLEQALVNLIDNAIKYSDNQSRVRVSARQEDSMVCISVSDNGPGIEKQHLSRLFERFYRVDQGRSRQMGGTGLGLSIVKHIAQVHGGRVEVDSTPGEGSTFSIFLKIA